MLKSATGFTLVELLVVIAIMGIIGTFVLANYRSFGEDQSLKNASLDIQSLLRQAQTNATANVQCSSDNRGALWQVVITSGTSSIDLKCGELSPTPTPAPTIKKTLPMPTNIRISTGCAAPVEFSPVTGTIRTCSCTVTLQNTKTENTKSFTIDKGGSIHE